MSANKNQTKGGGRKIGRNKVECARYRAQGRREKNKVRRLARHIREYPQDEAARDALSRLSSSA